MEIWKVIDEHPDYMISNIGRVKSLNYRHSGKEKILKGYKDKKGYHRVGLFKDGKRKPYFIHRLVAEAFIPNFENKPCIDHINTIRTDNRVENLRWVTNKENCNNPISKINYSIGNKGKTAVSVLQFTKEWEFVKKWNCIMDIKRELNISHQNISKCCLEKIKTAYGFKWGYAEDYEKVNFKVFDLEIYIKKVA